jgi:hypothetical protein
MRLSNIPSGPTREQLRAVDREHARIIKAETHSRFLALYRASLKEN